jgi:hypothetical protein
MTATVEPFGWVDAAGRWHDQYIAHCEPCGWSSVNVTRDSAALEAANHDRRLHADQQATAS